MQIKQINKLNNNLYEVIVENKCQEYAFKLAEEVLIAHNLYHQKVLTEEDFKNLNSLVNYSRIYNATLNFLSFKMRTEFEVREYIREKGCNEKSLEEIIQKLIKLKFINDKGYADAYVKHQFENNKKGPNLIIEELRNKHVDNRYIEESLTQINDELLKDNINRLIKNYVKLNKSKSQRKLKETILRSLVLKGYPYEIAVSELNAYPFSELNNDQPFLEKEIQKVLHKFENKFQGFELKNKIIKTLMNKGFIYEDIMNALKEIDLEGNYA